MPAIAIPAIVSAVGMGVNAYQQHKAQGALNAATANSEGIAASQEKRANQAFDIGTPLVQHAGSYYDTLLRGNRSQMAEEGHQRSVCWRRPESGTVGGARGGQGSRQGESLTVSGWRCGPPDHGCPTDGGGSTRGSG
jgi:hypothetical protein